MLWLKLDSIQRPASRQLCFTTRLLINLTLRLCTIFRSTFASAVCDSKITAVCRALLGFVMPRRGAHGGVSGEIGSHWKSRWLLQCLGSGLS